MRILLYSFRRCPYAIRARLALCYAQSKTRIVEVSLKNKPADLLALSPKGTVPVMVLGNGRVLDESLDIMRWALSHGQPQRHQLVLHETAAMNLLIHQNDQDFKYWLDRYKYYDRYPEFEMAYYRGQVARFLNILESQLEHHRFLFADLPSFADLAIFPFVRQCAAVDLPWFEAQHWGRLKRWHSYWLTNPQFCDIMQKRSLA